MTARPTLGEMFTRHRDRLKAVAWRIAVAGHRERSGPPPRREDTDTLIDRLAEGVLCRYGRLVKEQDADTALRNLTTFLILDFIGETGGDDADACPTSCVPPR